MLKTYRPCNNQMLLYCLFDSFLGRNYLNIIEIVFIFVNIVTYKLRVYIYIYIFLTNTWNQINVKVSPDVILTRSSQTTYCGNVDISCLHTFLLHFVINVSHYKVKMFVYESCLWWSRIQYLAFITLNIFYLINTCRKIIV